MDPNEMQARMQRMQVELESMEIDGQAGGGLVKVKLSGKGDLKGLTIDASLMNPNEVKMLEDLVVTAMQQAKGKLEEQVRGKMQAMTAGLQLPPGMKLF